MKNPSKLTRNAMFIRLYAFQYYLKNRPCRGLFPCLIEKRRARQGPLDLPPGSEFKRVSNDNQTSIKRCSAASPLPCSCSAAPSGILTTRHAPLLPAREAQYRLRSAVLIPPSPSIAMDAQGQSLCTRYTQSSAKPSIGSMPSRSNASCTCASVRLMPVK